MILHTQIVKMEESVDEKVESQNVSSPRILVKSSIALYTIFLIHVKQVMVCRYTSDWSMLEKVRYIAPCYLVSHELHNSSVYPSLGLS